MAEYGKAKPNFGPGLNAPARAIPAGQRLGVNATFTERFDREIGKVTQARGKEYGHPSIDFDRAAQIEAVVAACPDPKLRHVLYMIGTKLARLTQTPNHFDSWLDIAGYARTAMMVIDAENGKGAHDATEDQDRDGGPEAEGEGIPAFIPPAPRGRGDEAGERVDTGGEGGGLSEDG